MDISVRRKYYMFFSVFFYRSCHYWKKYEKDQIMKSKGEARYLRGHKKQFQNRICLNKSTKAQKSTVFPREV